MLAKVKKSPNVDDAKIGARVRLRRVQLGMSQEKLGEAIGLTFQQVQKYEKGVNRIGGSRMVQIAKILQCDIAYFFSDFMHDQGDRPAALIEQDDIIRRFNSSPQGIRIALRFHRIKDDRIKRHIVELVDTLTTEPASPH